jgi:signal transduction histidine kinase
MIKEKGFFLSEIAGSRFVKSMLRILGWGIVYYFTVRLSLAYFLTPNGVAIAWPPAGIFLAALLLSENKERPYVVVVFLIIDFLANLSTSVPYGTKFLFGLLSTADAAVSAWLLLRFVSNPFVLTKVKNVVMYMLLSVVLCHGLFSIPVSVATHYSQGSPFLMGWLYSWVAGSAGNLMLVPLIISWSGLKPGNFRKTELSRLIEVLILILLLIASNLWLFPYSKQGMIFSFIINYLSFPFVIWAILRFQMRIVTFVLASLTIIMLLNLMVEIQGFSNTSINQNFIFLQLYLGSISFISILLTAFKSEVKMANEALMEAERKLLLKTVEIEEQERNRYSRELHDGLGPLLSTIKMYLQRLYDTYDPEKVKFIATESEQRVKMAIQTMREISHGLSPLNLNNSGYVKAIQDFTKGINKLQGLIIDFSFNTTERCIDFYEIILYRITTELINNTLKHANATHAEIVFNYNKETNTVSLAYSDNGKGFDRKKEDWMSNGMGLQNIEQRIKILGGKFMIESEPDKGMGIYLDFPLKELDFRLPQVPTQPTILQSN